MTSANNVFNLITISLFLVLICHAKREASLEECSYSSMWAIVHYQEPDKKMTSSNKEMCASIGCKCKRRCVAMYNIKSRACWVYHLNVRPWLWSSHLFDSFGYVKDLDWVILISTSSNYFIRTPDFLWPLDQKLKFENIGKKITSPHSAPTQGYEWSTAEDLPFNLTQTLTYRRFRNLDETKILIPASNQTGGPLMNFNKPYTLMMWIKPEKSTGTFKPLFHCFYDSDNYLSIIMLQAPNGIALSVYFNKAAMLTITKSSKFDRWVHATVTYNGKNGYKGIKVFVDGNDWPIKKRSPSNYYKSGEKFKNLFAIGYNKLLRGPKGFKGKIACVILSSYQINDKKEIEEHMNSCP